MVLKTFLRRMVGFLVRRPSTEKSTLCSNDRCLHWITGYDDTTNSNTTRHSRSCFFFEFFFIKATRQAIIISREKVKCKKKSQINTNLCICLSLNNSQITTSKYGEKNCERQKVWQKYEKENTNSARPTTEKSAQIHPRIDRTASTKRRAE